MKETQSILEHLEELRRRILISVGFIAVFSFLGYFVSDPVFKLLTSPLKGTVDSLYFFTPYEAFVVKLKISLITGVAISIPLIITEIWLFIAPGLYEREKKIVLLGVLSSILLFATGALFCFFVIIPFALKFLLGFGGPSLKPVLSVGQYVNFVSLFVISFGVAFNLPVFVAGAVRLGILRAETLRKQWRLAIVLIFIAAAILTPGPDVLSQVLLAIPLLFLYVICLWVAALIERK